MQLTQRDDTKKRVSTILIQVDRLIRSKDFDRATLELAAARELDASNAYIQALEERVRVEGDAEKQRKASTKEPEVVQTPPAVSFELRAPQMTRVGVPAEVHRNSAQEPGSRDHRQKIAEARLPITPTRGKITTDASRSAPPEVVVIDDDVEILELLTETLGEAGFHPIAVPTSDQALTYLRTHTPELIMCDVNLETSTMGGFGFYEHIQQLVHLKNIPFVFLSGMTDEVMMRTGKELGADDYLLKPIDDQLLIATLRGKINRFRKIRTHLASYQPA